MTDTFATGTSCRGCGSTHAKSVWQVPERMFGTGDTFHYDECADCGALSIDHVPSDLDRHYPSNYYSYQAVGAPKGKISSFKESFYGLPANDKRTSQTFDRMALPSTERILDVGSGAGKWLLHFSFSKRDSSTFMG